MKKYMLSPKGRKLHRRLGLIFGVYLLIAAISGVAHNVIALNFPHIQMAQRVDTLDLPDDAVSPSQAVRAAGGGSTAAIALRQVKGTLYYQVILPETAAPIYVNAATGAVAGMADAALAREIAEKAMPRQRLSTPVYLTAHDDEYREDYRPLPAYRFDAGENGEIRLYVSTLTNGVVLVTTDTREILAAIFRTLHLFSFISSDAVRLWLLIFLAAGGVLTAAFGLAMVWVRWSGRRG